MDGNTVRKYINAEVNALWAKYKQFEFLVPNKKDQSKGSDHNAEDGRFIEALVRDTLRKFLPKGLEVLTGFIVRPAVKVENNNKSRKKKQDSHSGQIDIIIYDSANYPLYYQSGDTALVPPEGVIGIISVKKNLAAEYIVDEVSKLYKYSQLCRSDKNGTMRRGPFLALVAMDGRPQCETCYKHIRRAYQNREDLYFDDVIGYVGILKKWSIFKKRPSNASKVTAAKLVGFIHGENEQHMGLQFLLSGILSVFYDPSRNVINKPGFTAFPRSLNAHELGSIKILGVRTHY